MLTSLQIACLIILLQAFNVDPAAIARVQAVLTPAPTQQPAPQTVPIFGSTDPIPTPQPDPTPIPTRAPAPTPAPVVALPAMDPFIVRKVEISYGGYLRIYANHAFTLTISSGTLGNVLVDNEMDSEPGEHNYDYKLTGYQRPLTVTMTDSDGQVQTRSVQ